MINLVDRRLEMQYVGSESMFQTIVDQSRNPSPSINVVALVPGAVLKGAISTGMAEAFHQAKATNGIDALVCHSAGAFTSLAMAEGAMNTRRTFYDFCVKTNLVSLKRRSPIDLVALENEFAVKIPIDVDTLHERRTRLKVVLADLENGGVIVVDPAEEGEHPLKTVVKSTTWPYGITNKQVERDSKGRLVGDGGVGDPIPLEAALKLSPTHLIVFSPFTRDERLPEIDKLYPFSWLIENGLMPKPAELLLQMSARFNAVQEEMYTYATGEKQIPGVEFGIIAPTRGVDGFKLHASNLRRSQIRARIFTSDLFRKYTN